MKTETQARPASHAESGQPRAADTFQLQLKFTESVIRKNVGDVTHEESLQSFQPAGNGLNWVLGHLVAIRSQLLVPLGGEPVWSTDECAPYDRHAAPFTGTSKPKLLAEIWRAFELTQTRLLEVAARLTPAELAEAVPAGTPAKTRGELLAVLGFHDAYHAGQTGVIRRLLGKPPADL
jgi:uncharacterized damage-inducible protein DinB